MSSEWKFTAEDVFAMMAAEQAERYAALHAAFGDDVDAMLMFPWSPPVEKEPRMRGETT